MSNLDFLHLNEFINKVSIPKFTSDSAAQLLFVSSLISPDDWITILSHIYETKGLSSHTCQLINEWVSKTNIEKSLWNELSSYLDNPKLAQMPLSNLESSSQDMHDFKNAISNSINNQIELNSIILAKLYLMAYQEKWQEFLPDVFEQARYNTKKAITDFIKMHPCLDTDTLIKIMHTMKK